MNDFMSGGLHRLWKDHFVAKLGPVRGTTIVDLAGGTGDISFRILDALKRSPMTANIAKGETEAATRVIVCDINADMLGEGRRRAESIAVAPGVQLSFVQGDAESLPMADGSVDAVTIAFGLRNVTRTALALSEARRVLRKGGRFLIMEFSQPVSSPIRAAYDVYSAYAIPAMGAAITGHPEAYSYLVESIRRFPTQEVLAQMMRDQGFACVEYENLLDGIVAIHSGFRP